MIRKLCILFFLIYLPVLNHSQDNPAIFGLGGTGGVSIITSENGIEPTGHLSVFWDKYITPQDRFIRLQCDLGCWNVERKKNETFGYQAFKWQIYHLSTHQP